jgi:hypothetical protein
VPDNIGGNFLPWINKCGVPGKLPAATVESQYGDLRDMLLRGLAAGRLDVKNRECGFVERYFVLLVGLQAVGVVSHGLENDRVLVEEHPGEH